MEQILLSLGMLLLFAKLLGNLFERFGIASLVGEIIAGIILGPVLGWVVMGGSLEGFMTLGIIFLMFIAGMEVRLDDIKENIYKAVFLAVTGGLLSFALGFVVGIAFFGDTLVAIAIGAVIISTSNGALFLLLMRAGKFDSKTGKFIIAITIADDIVGIMGLALFRMYLNASVSFFSLFFIMLVALGFYMVILTAGSEAVKRIVNRLHMVADENMLFTIPIAIMFLLAFVTDNLNLSMAAGAFLAGMAVSNSHFAEPVISPKVKVIAHGFLLPLFYASIGTILVLSNLNPMLIVAIVAAAMLGKLIGCGLMSKVFGFKSEDAKLIGFAMMPRGEENIAILQLLQIIAAVGLAQVHTSIVFAIITTTILAPILVKIVLGVKK